MAWFESTPVTLFKKEYAHNLGHKPIVMAFVDLSTLSLGTGWKPIPFDYSIYTGGAYYVGSVYYYHKDDNTVVFVAPENTEIVADIFIDPQNNAWYE